MINSMMRGIRLGLLLSAAGIVIGSDAQAQSGSAGQFPPGAVVQPLPTDDGAELRRHLMALADNPRALDPLIGAGRAALAGGDTQAALTFFARAAEVAPRDARVKAGMASVLVQMERGQPALNLFAEAVALGAPVVEIAGDRGLAHDMVGDPRRAQQDYALVLQQREEPEIRRRLALSLAISGDRAAALRVIDGQLRRNDRAAWRTQAFILALTGDPAGANRTAQGLMPPAAAAAMAPFFARLSSLSPTEKAMAAHFGRFPSNGGAALADRGGRAVAGAPPAVSMPSQAAPAPAASAPARNQEAAAPRTVRRRAGPAEALPRRTARQGAAASGPRQSQASADRASAQLARAEPEVPRPAEPAQATARQAAPPPSSPPPAVVETRATARPSAPPGTGSSPASSPSLADIRAVISSLPEDEEATSPAAAATAPARTPARETSTEQRSARGGSRAEAHPARHWVQIAGGANVAALPQELGRLRQKAPELADRNAWVVPANATNRLLVGPFASAAEAQAFVNVLARRDVSSFAWSSGAGQEISRLRH